MKGQAPSVKDIRRLIFDFDTFIYRCGFAAEHKVWYVEDPENADGRPFFQADTKKELNEFIKKNPGASELVWMEHIVEPVENALSNFKNAVNNVLSKFPGAADYEGYLSDGPGFRAAVATTRVYKGNRDPEAKPRHYDSLRDYAQRKYDAEIVSRVEADDMCGIALAGSSGSGCVVSNDKDLRQIPGWHYNWTKPDEPPTWVRPKDAVLKFYEQLISGDPTDNVVGIPGIGTVGALKALAGASSPEDCERRAWELYKGNYPVPDGVERLQFLKDRFLENGRLVRILRRQEEVPTIRPDGSIEGKLWEPTIDLK
jgi:hypothetical protein